MSGYQWMGVDSQEGFLQNDSLVAATAAAAAASARSYPVHEEDTGMHVLPQSSLFAESVASHLQIMSSPMKTDGFLNWGNPDADQQPAVRSDASPCLCPCCNNPIATSLQAHIAQCFLESSPLTSSSSSPLITVDDVLGSINHLGLRTRLAMMESLYRLSKTKSSSGGNAVSSKAEAHDNAVLALLFATKAPAASKAAPFIAPSAPSPPTLKIKDTNFTSNVPGERSASYQFPI